MAEVRWPGREAHRIKRYAALKGIPFLITDDGEYPDGVNHYLFERVRGSLPALIGAGPRLVPRRLSGSSARQIAYNLSDLLRWAATAAAHPDIGAVHWCDLKSWHIIELYQDALNLGYWTQAYFTDRHPFPLHPDTVRTRVSEALRCYVWLATQGYVRDFRYEPTFRLIQLSKDSALLSYRSELSQVVVNDLPTRTRRIRSAPCDMPLPTMEHLAAFFETLPKGAMRLAVLQLFETGMRAQELVENTLIPDRMHERDRGPNAWCLHPSWPGQPYRLKHSMSDDRMLGVIPTREMAWHDTARKGYQCEYRIIGKGPKIRKVHLPPKLLRAIWNYLDTSRMRLEAHHLARGVKPNAHVYLNRFGMKLSYHSIWEACDRANKKLRAPLDLTPHTFRHAYACYFLEGALRARAESQALDPENMSLNFIRDEGDLILMVIKEELGHAEFATTRRYLHQIIAGRIGLLHHETWNRFLDSAEIGFDE